MEDTPTQTDIYRRQRHCADIWDSVIYQPPLADVYSDSVQHHWDNSLISQLYPDVACGAVWVIFSASGPFAP